jgi:hypothetical protein
LADAETFDSLAGARTGPAAHAEGDTLPLVAYHVIPELAMPLVPAESARGWMASTVSHFANRCLPLLIANQAGWFVLTPHAVRATWTGGDATSDIVVEYLDGTAPYSAVSHFGHGILTWRIPYLFRTPRGWNLCVRGPSNRPKDGACPLEGIVETDWAVATFTMNWKLTRPWAPVVFEKGEPICMLLPQRRGELERFAPTRRSLDDNPELADRYRAWRDSRMQFNTELFDDESPAAREGWQRDYFRGRGAADDDPRQHQLKLKLRPFTDL